MKYLLVTLFILGFSFQSNAQYFPYEAYSAGEINLAAKDNEFAPSAALNNFSRGQFKIGFAFRLTSFFAKNKTYITAPAKFTSGKVGPGVFFADQIPANIDTIKFIRPKGHFLNVAILLEYSFNQNWAAGFNIDLLGVTFGNETKGQYKDLNQQTLSAKPTFFNALLISDNDRGSLNSEFYGKYFMSDNPTYFKFGASFYFNEQKTLKKQRLGNDRFRYKSLAPLVGVGYLFNNSIL